MGRKKKTKPQSKVFRITVLGRAEAGKTSLCMRVISNTVMKGYEHTTHSQIYHREIDTKTLPLLHSTTNSNNSTDHPKHSHKKNKPAKKKKKNKKSKKILQTYGLQIEDVPGEISGGLENLTEEKDTIHRDYENNGYQQLYHDTATWLGASTEGAPLIAKPRNTAKGEVEKHVNLLYIPMVGVGVWPVDILCIPCLCLTSFLFFFCRGRTATLSCLMCNLQIPCRKQKI